MGGVWVTSHSVHASEAARLTLGKHTVIYLFVAGALDITVRSKNTC